ncbi:MAG: hypothetical protein EOO80_00295 [Oxalobacteraceae bacterium]|nr:MAG: hypothetical protein EOO80_00295 [Oxalobacteraceae bacterium]
MTAHLHRIAATVLAATIAATINGAAHAFTDTNAELKEAAASARPAKVGMPARAASAQTAWVPVSAKRLDSFKPVLPARPDAAQTLARAELPAAIKR